MKIAQRRPRTLRTKLIESAIALRLEQSWSKEKILCAYLNRVDFGNLNIGISAAADYYFGKPVADLSEAEAAFLAGLPRNPRRLNPHVALGDAQKRQETVLRRMQENGWLDARRVTIWPAPNRCGCARRGGVSARRISRSWFCNRRAEIDGLRIAHHARSAV